MVFEDKLEKKSIFGEWVDFLETKKSSEEVEGEDTYRLLDSIRFWELMLEKWSDWVGTHDL